MLSFSLLLLLLWTEPIWSRWKNPNVYAWLEQNSYICFLELKPTHGLRFLLKEEAERLQCSCGDPLLTHSACARSNNLKKPFCTKLPDLCMRTYSTIFMPSHRTKVNLTDLQLTHTFAKINKTVIFSNGLKAGIGRNRLTVRKNNFFTMGPKFIPKVDKQPRIEKSTDLKTSPEVVKVHDASTVPPSSIISTVTVSLSSSLPGTVPPIAETSSPGLSPTAESSSQSTTFSSTTASSQTSSTISNVTISSSTTVSPVLFDGEVAAPIPTDGIEIFLNNTNVMNRLMDILIRRIIESSRSSNSSLLEKLEGLRILEPLHTESKKKMIKMASSHEEEAPIQRVVFTEIMKDVNNPDDISQNSLQNDSLVLTASGSVGTATSTQLPETTTTKPTEEVLIISAPVTSVPIRIRGPKPPRRNKTLFHDRLIRLQKQLFNILGEKFDDLDDEDSINDNDIITVFREHMHDEDEGSLAFSDDKGRNDSHEWPEDDTELSGKTTKFNPKVCEDNHSFCEKWAVSKRCRVHAGFMYKFCRKSCGICE